MLISELYSLFLRDQSFRGNSDVTISWYKENLEPFFLWMNSDNISSLSLECFKNYGVYLRNVVKRNGSKLSSASVQGAMRAVKAFYNFCIEYNALEDFSRDLHLPKAHLKEQLILDDTEISSLLSIFGEGIIEIRNKCFVVLMLDCGLRRGELPRINVGDVNFRAGTILVRGKGNKQRIVPLGFTSSKLLSSYLQSRDSTYAQSDPFFLDFHGFRCSDNLIKQVFQDLKLRSGIERLHPHLLRHTFATYYLADGGDLETLRLILGHSSIQTTQRYLHLAFNVRLSRQKHLSHLDNLNLK